MNTNQTDEILSVTTLNELLACNDQHFVHCAYHTLLNRKPDTEGMNYYLSRLRNGSLKTEILAQLKSSPEGQSCPKDLPGLDRVIQQYQRGRYPLIGWLFKVFYRTQNNSSIDQNFRRIENNLFRINQEFESRLNNIENKLSLISQEFENGFNNIENKIAFDSAQIKIEIRSSVHKINLIDRGSHKGLDGLVYFNNTRGANGIVQPPLDSISLMVNIKEEISRRGNN